jgi:hypothetical protein
MGNMPDAGASIAETLSILETKRAMLLANMIAADAGLCGEGGNRGFQPRADTVGAVIDGLAWVQGRVDADFLLPQLAFWFEKLRFLGVTKLPKWEGEPHDSTKALELLDGLIDACKEAVKGNASVNSQSVSDLAMAGVAASPSPAIQTVKGTANGATDVSSATPSETPGAPARKRSTERGEGRAKLIAALTKHHQYADGGCLSLEPIGNNELAKAAGVSPSTASTFFNDNFQGHTKYKSLCRNASMLTAALKMLNDEFAPYHLLGTASSDLAAPDEEDTDE